MEPVDPTRWDVAYASFPSIDRWLTAAIDGTYWAAVLVRLRAAQAAVPVQTRDDEVHKSLRAAALNTGALEGLHAADRGLTLTVITDAAWQAALERAEGKEAVTFVEAALEAFDVALDLATTAQPLSEAIIRRLHEIVTAPQDTYEVETTIGRQG